MSQSPIIYGKPEPIAALDYGVIRYSEELHAHSEENILCKDGRLHFGPDALGYWFDGTATDDTLWRNTYSSLFEKCFNKGLVHPNDWYWDEEERCFIEMATLSDEDYLIASMSAERVTIYETAP